VISKTSDKTVANTLAHAFAADRVWLGPNPGNPPASFIIDDQDRHLECFRKEWPGSATALEAMGARRLATRMFSAKISYKD